MNAKKFLLATVAGFVGIFVISWLLYEVILGGYFEEAWKDTATREQPLMWAFIVAQLCAALIMAFLYPKGYEGGAPATEGLRFGIIMGLFVSIMADLGIYTYMPIPFTTALVDIIVLTVAIGVGGLLIGLVYGRPAAAA